ncbi:MAG: type IV-A pilus assembly ATPase PilB [Oligoflexia bacterium]|nr:type IV-A pilus assembly ATPase PilB [Oligoflexia bacterium]
MAAKGLGELLVREQLITIDQLENAKKTQKQAGGGRLASALVKLGYVNEQNLTEFLSKQYQVPAIDLATFEIDPDALKLVSKEICEKHSLIPISKSGNTIVVAMADPSNLFARDDVQFLTRCKIEVVVASETAIHGAIERNYASKVTFESVMTEIEKDTSGVETTRSTSPEVTVVDVDRSQTDAPVVKFVNLMLAESIKQRASDIHIEPYEKRFRVRFRIDGTLFERIQPPAEISAAISSRLKIMSKLDISERRRPQDGRLKIRTKDNREIDFRVSVLPTLFGEKIVMRLLDRSNLQLDLAKLGFEPPELEKFKNAIHAPYGMVLVTGPTGSGKSTTIYSALTDLNSNDVNISTAEDPVEYNIEGINQVQMNPEVDLTFASALRSFLRQDPDIIMVGEIRDFETAEIGFKAALTGHLVVSTLHTNDAPSTVNRLINMGVEPFLVTAGVNLILAQRLIRKICDRCKAPVQVDPQLLVDLGMTMQQAKDTTVYQGHGCQACGDIGYKGRIAIYEVMPFSEALKQLVYQGASPSEIKKKAIEEGLITLRMSGLNKLQQGLTTIQEVMDSSPKDIK